MKSVEIKNSTKADKKKMAIFYEDGKKIKTVHFGASGMDDYTKTKDKEQRKRYRQRHEKDLKTKDPMKAGYLSYYILWGDSTSLDEKRFGFK